MLSSSSNIDGDIARQLSAYIKENKSLYGCLHVIHRITNPYIDSGEIRTWYVGGKLVEIKDWLVDDSAGLIHYPFPHCKFWPNNCFYRKLRSRGVQFPSPDNNKVRWRQHNGRLAPLDASTEAQSDLLPPALDALNLNIDLHQSHTSWSSASPNDHTSMALPNSHPELLGPQSTSEKFPQFMDLTDHLNVTADGTVDRFIKRRVAVPDERDTMAVFVHAGAGYHSLQNEHVHLTMCAK